MWNWFNELWYTETKTDSIFVTNKKQNSKTKQNVNYIYIYIYINSLTFFSCFSKKQIKKKKKNVPVVERRIEISQWKCEKKKIVWEIEIEALSLYIYLRVLLFWFWCLKLYFFLFFFFFFFFGFVCVSLSTFSLFLSLNCVLNKELEFIEFNIYH